MASRLRGFPIIVADSGWSRNTIQRKQGLHIYVLFREAALQVFQRRHVQTKTDFHHQEVPVGGGP
jgi:hypothetical protein